MTVFEAHLLGRKRDAPRHDESGLPFTEQRQSRDRVRAGVMSMNDGGVPLTGDGPQLARRADIPLTPQGESVRGQPRLVGVTDERRSGRRNDEGAIAEVA